MSLSQNNAFTQGYGHTPIAKKRKYITVQERVHAESAAKRTAALLAFKAGQINIPPQSDADRRASFSKAAI